MPPSTRRKRPQAKAPPKSPSGMTPEKAEELKPKSMKVVELREALQARNLLTTGLKAVLVSRLEEALASEGAKGTVPQSPATTFVDLDAATTPVKKGLQLEKIEEPTRRSSRVYFIVAALVAAVATGGFFAADMDFAEVGHATQSVLRTIPEMATPLIEKVREPASNFLEMTTPFIEKVRVPASSFLASLTDAAWGKGADPSEVPYENDSGLVLDDDNSSAGVAEDTVEDPLGAATARSSIHHVAAK